jgi:hypothetical protein
MERVSYTTNLRAVCKFLLELARSDASIVSRILNHPLLSRFEKVDFSRYAEHALEGIGKQDGDKAEEKVMNKRLRSVQNAHINEILRP